MRVLAALLLLIASVLPSHAGIVWDETVNGELSHNAATPTPINLTVGSNILNGSVINSSGRARDFVLFNLPPDHVLIRMNLLAYAPNDIGFLAINYGAHSYVPSLATDPLFLSGIHLFATDVGSDLLDLMVNRAVTAESLYEHDITLDGNYSIVIQQLSAVTTTYSIEFVMTGPVTAENKTWGAIKALYR